MIKIAPFLILLLASCAAPKYTYYFDHYTPSSKTQSTNSASVGSPLAVDINRISASTTVAPAALPSVGSLETRAINGSKKEIDAAAPEKKIALQRPDILHEQIANKASDIHGDKGAALSHIDRKELKQALKSLRKDIRSGRQRLDQPPTDQATQKLDDEVIVAIAFGAVGITLSLLGGISAAFWIAGVILLGVGVYFFFRWLSHR